MPNDRKKKNLQKIDRDGLWQDTYENFDGFCLSDWLQDWTKIPHNTSQHGEKVFRLNTVEDEDEIYESWEDVHFSDSEWRSNVSEYFAGYCDTLEDMGLWWKPEFVKEVFIYKIAKIMGYVGYNVPDKLRNSAERLLFC